MTSLPLKAQTRVDEAHPSLLEFGQGQRVDTPRVAPNAGYRGRWTADDAEPGGEARSDARRPPIFAGRASARDRIARHDAGGAVALLEPGVRDDHGRGVPGRGRWRH